jgi:tRNA (cmo5U34)-methyltransferase
MNDPTPTKSTTEEIRARFDADVERFSNLETGQRATLDAPLVMDLIARAAMAGTPSAGRILDLGCGAGNYALHYLTISGQNPDVDLLDLSPRMVERAVERVTPRTSGVVRPVVGDFREADLPAGGYDVIMAAAVLHHLRDDADWETAFARLHRLLRPGGKCVDFRSGFPRTASGPQPDVGAVR